jgi:hypothetical protein
MTLEEKALEISGLCLSAYFMVYGWYWYLRSIKFYYRRNWDLTEDFGPPIYKSDPGDEDNKASPRLKFLIYLPMIAVIGSIMFVVVTLGVLGVVPRYQP